MLRDLRATASSAIAVSAVDSAIATYVAGHKSLRALPLRVV